MKKKWIYLAGTVLVCLGAYFCGRLAADPFPDFRILCSGNEEVISCWSGDGSSYYVFLPSYAELSQVQVITDKTLYLDGTKLSDGDFCGGYSLNEPYELRIGNRNASGYSLEFVKSANTAAMYIETKSGDMDQIHKDKDYEEGASMALYNSDGTVNFTDGGGISVSGRGNYSWFLDKKPYIIKLPEEGDLLGMGTAEKWILLANAIDNTNLRNKLIYDFAGEFQEYWSPECEYVDLYLNGEYAGLYLLAEKVEVGENRLNLGEGSYLFNLDLDTRNADPATCIAVNEGTAAEIQYPKEISEVHLQAAKRLLQEMQQALLAEDGVNADTKKSWDEYIDADSWAWKYLIEEVFENYDAGACSQYFYWNPEGDDRRIFAGPIWDYDNTLGASTQKNPRCFLAQRMWKAPEVYTPWFGALCEKEEFYNRVVALYETRFLPKLQELADSGIEEAAKQIADAAEMNRLRWSASYEDLQVSEWVELMQSFLEERIEFLNSAWLDGKQYRNICLEIPKDYRYFEVEKGTCIESLPTPAELDISDSLVWYDKETGELFDESRPIVEDMVLYDKDGEDSEGKL